MDIYVKNRYEIPIKKWCITCDRKGKCNKLRKDKNIECWIMNKNYNNAGNGNGVVRKLVIHDGPFKKFFEFTNEILM